MRNVMMVCSMLLFSPMLFATEFVGQFEGCEEGLVSLNGKTYPRQQVMSADYRGRLVTLCSIPRGTRITYSMENVNGVGTVVSVAVTEANAELDQLFPPR